LKAGGWGNAAELYNTCIAAVYTVEAAASRSEVIRLSAILCTIAFVQRDFISKQNRKTQHHDCVFLRYVIHASFSVFLAGRVTL
jgi:hypothetical protein